MLLRDLLDVLQIEAGEGVFIVSSHRPVARWSVPVGNRMDSSILRNGPHEAVAIDMPSSLSNT